MAGETEIRVLRAGSQFLSALLGGFHPAPLLRSWAPEAIDADDRAAQVSASNALLGGLRDDAHPLIIEDDELGRLLLSPGSEEEFLDVLLRRTACAIVEDLGIEADMPCGPVWTVLLTGLAILAGHRAETEQAPEHAFACGYDAACAMFRLLGTDAMVWTGVMDQAKDELLAVLPARPMPLEAFLGKALPIAFAARARLVLDGEEADSEEGLGGEPEAPM
ncbi:protein of unknown function (plasmid) [Magnetospirillum sp. XM-1]|uniref:hypothetical protein n=1 Tax=Magnetospirillum sp. XM-1 TaxID=1663591 RepID=UPI00073DD868|nr:hypothetical protein [Magnetospirillum sp. XM-1]CUW41897.1 protein of unknown function [Magnetospirillum sp. XM-1]